MTEMHVEARTNSECIVCDAPATTDAGVRYDTGSSVAAPCCERCRPGLTARLRAAAAGERQEAMW